MNKPPQLQWRHTAQRKEFNVAMGHWRAWASKYGTSSSSMEISELVEQINDALDELSEIMSGRVQNDEGV